MTTGPLVRPYSAEKALAWTSLPDQSYVIQYKAGLDASAWMNIATNRSMGTLTYFNDTNASRLGQPQGFYRVVKVVP